MGFIPPKSMYCNCIHSSIHPSIQRISCVSYREASSSLHRGSMKRPASEWGSATIPQTIIRDPPRDVFCRLTRTSGAEHGYYSPIQHACALSLLSRRCEAPTAEHARYFGICQSYTSRTAASPAFPSRTACQLSSQASWCIARVRTSMPWGATRTCFSMQVVCLLLQRSRRFLLPRVLLLFATCRTYTASRNRVYQP